MPNFAGKVAGNFIKGVFESLQEEHALGVEARGAELRPLSFGESLAATDVDPVPQARPTPEQMPNPLLLLSFTPTLLGDVTGLGLDAVAFARGDLEPTAGNFALSALGLLPFVPALSSIKKVGDDTIRFFKKQAEEVRTKRAARIAAGEDLGFAKAKATEFLPENFSAFDDDFLEEITIGPSGFFTMSDETFLKMNEIAKFSEGSSNLAPKKALVEFRKLEKEANDLADLVDKLKADENRALEKFFNDTGGVPHEQFEEILGLQTAERLAAPPSKAQLDEFSKRRLGKKVDTPIKAGDDADFNEAVANLERLHKARLSKKVLDLNPKLEQAARKTVEERFDKTFEIFQSGNLEESTQAFKEFEDFIDLTVSQTQSLPPETASGLKKLLKIFFDESFP